jgi:Tfp pilus assembly protein FimT
MLVAIIVCIALPEWQHHSQLKQLKAVKAMLETAINYTRTSAIINQQALVLCSPDNRWAKGFRVVISKPKYNCQQSKIIRQWVFNYSDKLDVNWHGFDKHQQLLFSSDPNHWAVNGRFTLSLGNQKPIELLVNRIGGVTVR